MAELLHIANPWFWLIVAGLLLAGELMAPGFFLMWLGIAAVLTGLVDFIWPLGWAGEVATFALLSLVLVMATWRFVMSSRNMKSDEPHLNRRHGAYVGRVVALEQAIVNGTGKVKLDDTLWTVEGPDLPAGARVRITGTTNMGLIAEAA